MVIVSLFGRGHSGYPGLLYSRSWISNERPSLLFDLATGWLIQHKILLPGASTLTRLISQIRDRAENRLWQQLSSLPNSDQQARLDSLLQIPEAARTTHFDRFRKGQSMSVALHLMRLLNVTKHFKPME